MKSLCDLFKGSLMEECIISIYFICSQKVLKYIQIEQWVYLWEKINIIFYKMNLTLAGIFIYTVTAEVNRLSECRRIIASIRDRAEKVTR